MTKPSKKLRILLSTNAPFASSGYAQQAQDLAPAIRDLGYPIAVNCFYGLEGGKIMLDGIMMYPKLGDVWGSDGLISHGKDFNADIVITLQDIWVLDPNNMKQVKRWIPILPVDHDPIPPMVLDKSKMAYRVVTYSQFGFNQMKNKGIHTTYIPHTVNTEVYKPYPKEEMKKMMGIDPDTFLFGMVAANKDMPPRKGFQEAMDAFKMFHDKHPNSKLYMHVFTDHPGGFPINQYAQALGISDSIIKIDPYQQLMNTSKDRMAQIYSAMDCLLAPSRNEGFGVPIIEAQSCGVPVITTAWTAMTELVQEGKTGYACEPIRKEFTPLLSYAAVPDANKVYESMEKIFDADRKKMAKDCRTFIVKNYDFKTVFNNKWVPFLEKVEKEVYRS